MWLFPSGQWLFLALAAWYKPEDEMGVMSQAGQLLCSQPHMKDGWVEGFLGSFLSQAAEPWPGRKLPEGRCL